MLQLSPSKAINPAYKKYKVLRQDINDFKSSLRKCIEAIELSDAKNESEEHLKEPIKRFLNQTFYRNNLINTKDRIDLAIYLGEDSKSNLGVIIEAKRPSNKAEFISPINLNKKALHELLLYYLRERIDGKNNNIKHLIATNGLEWFFFKAEDFYTLFYSDKDLRKEYEQFRDGLKDTTKNELFYNEIAAKYIAKNSNNLPFVYLDFSSEKLDSLSDQKLSSIYKVFSDVHLLGKSFGNDGNSLNKDFYNELLHIIGLEEVKDSGKRVIQRKAEKSRDYGTLLENAIFTLEDKDYLNKVKHVVTSDEKAFTVGLELCLTWVNRVLFLKLLESQLLSYNDNKAEYKFLNTEFIKGFDELNDLFFSALAKPLKDRHPKYKEKFINIPYLNSSLFEHNEIEAVTFDITALKDEDMEVYSSTVLKDSSGKKFKGRMDTLEYLFKFLDAYDFSVEGSDDIEEGHENKTLINASVLGLIFEKINGYKDGSFYTPSYITMFMCKEGIRKAIVDKFKEDVSEQIESFDDLKDYCSAFFKKADLEKVNRLVNSIKICDPAVGSGHFLVSALNEIIAVKSELNILCDEEGKKLPCSVIIENDELYISHQEGELFEYKRNDVNSFKIQKALFHEKQNIIENSLFGVDINPNSVNICRLRLWIELLKNAYYTTDGELQTLPNIDINIKCGNSLISRFDLKDTLKTAFKGEEVVFSIEDYKNAVRDYKRTNSKEKKREVLEIISKIKHNFKSTLDKNLIEKVQKAVGTFKNEELRLSNLEQFGEKIAKKEKDALKKLKVKADDALKLKEEILNNVIYLDAFEWRFEFPEVLDDEGVYLGFDLIIGNPPYIQLQKMGKVSDDLQKLDYKTFAKTGDIYSLFYELGYNVLKTKGALIYITSNKWMRAAYGESLRQFFIDYTDSLILIDFGGVQIFDTATVDTNILMFSKDKNRQQTLSCVAKDKELKNLSDYFRQNATITAFNSSDSWVVLSDIEKSIKAKIEALGTPLKDWDISINYGIKTGYNEAFIISSEKRKELIAEDPKSDEIIRPILRGRDIKKYSYEFADLYLLYIPWHFPLHLDSNIKGASVEAENAFSQNYPAIYNHLLNYKTQLSNRNKTETGIRYEWYALQRWGSNYWRSFSQEKIVWKRVGSILKFSFDQAGTFVLDSTCFVTGKNLKYLTAILNSPIGNFLLRNSPKTGTGDLLISVQAIEPLLVPLLKYEAVKFIENKIDSILNKDSEQIQILNNFLYTQFNLTTEEIDFIELL